MDGPCWTRWPTVNPGVREVRGGEVGWRGQGLVLEGARALGPPPAPGTRLVAAAVQAAVVVSAAGERCAGGHLTGVAIVTGGGVVARAAWPCCRGIGMGGS